MSFYPFAFKRFQVKLHEIKAVFLNNLHQGPMLPEFVCTFVRLKPNFVKILTFHSTFPDKYNKIEEDLIAEFRASYRSGEKNRMKELASILTHFKVVWDEIKIHELVK